MARDARCAMTRQSKDNVRVTIEGPAYQVSRLLGSMRLKDEEESDPDRHKEPEPEKQSKRRTST